MQEAKDLHACRECEERAGFDDFYGPANGCVHEGPDYSESKEFFAYLADKDLPHFHLFGNSSHPFASDHRECPHRYDADDWRRELSEAEERQGCEVGLLYYDCPECEQAASQVIESLELSEEAKERAEQARTARICRCDGCERAKAALPAGLKAGHVEIIEQVRASAAPLFHSVNELTGWMLGMAPLEQSQCPHEWAQDDWAALAEGDLWDLVRCDGCAPRFATALSAHVASDHP
ncbi:hypothetical protein [Microbacterium sp. SORGH_AS_0888]|uniref:hypothetical protein n=1 Tax=Microbacterium sp. SORGH_AS_0888 TaxID=3041791 RepID=UPI0027D77967|nr:hypothetical protein [Microbacterium sp. SORGH_AS_0888]